MYSSIYESYALLRSILKSGSDADVAKAVAYGKQVKVYPLSQAAHPPETKFADALDVVFDSTIPYDERFFQSLNRIVQYEPWLERDKAMIDPLKSIGIEKGKPFNPDSKTQDALKVAATEAHAWLDANYENVFKPPFNPGTQWALPASQEFVAAIESNYAARQLPNRCTRPRLFLRLFQRQASRCRTVLSDDDQRQSGAAAQWSLHLSPHRPGQRTRKSILVGNGLRR